MDKPFQPDFLIIPYKVLNDKRLRQTDAILYGVIYWYERLKDGKCFASNAELGRVAGIAVKSVTNSLTRLEAYGYIQRVYRDEANFERASIKSLVTFDVVPTSPDVVPLHHVRNRESNKRESNIDSSVAERALDNPNYVKALLNLYGDLYKHYVGVAYKVMSYPKDMAQLKRLDKQFSPAQTRAILFQHFEWRGATGDDNFHLKRLQSAGYPIGWLSANAGNYAAYLEKTMKEWNDELSLCEKVDTWVKELSDGKND